MHAAMIWDNILEGLKFFIQERDVLHVHFDQCNVTGAIRALGLQAMELCMLDRDIMS